MIPNEASIPPRAVVFDLDGTLVDPAGGITAGIAHGLRSQGLPVPDSAVLEEMVGPPLALGLSELAAVPADRIPSVIDAYRSWYASEGMAMSRTYPGVPELLTALRGLGVPLAVATSKPQPIAERLLAAHGLTGSFEAVVGTSADETEPPAANGSKEHLLRAAASRLGVPVEQSVMVGDRKYDMQAAVATAARGMGAGWGFGSREELVGAGAEAVLSSPAQALDVLTGKENR